MRLNEKVAIVTGAAQGIGLGVALELVKNGAKVALSDISKEALEKAKKLGLKHGEVVGIVADVTDAEQVNEMVKTVVDKWGKIDILVNNAGVYPFKAFEEMTQEDWDRVMNINVTGTFNCVKAAYPLMKENGGSVVNIASIAGTTVGYNQLTHYSASKAAVLGFTKAAALEFAPHKIRVNAIAPGAIMTPGVDQAMDEETVNQTIESIPWKRMGRPEDIGNAVVFLASDESDYITGQLIIVDGGLTVQ